MPLLKILTNSATRGFEPTVLQCELASKAAELVGKKLDYVMTSLEFSEHMTFAGTDEQQLMWSSRTSASSMQR